MIKAVVTGNPAPSAIRAIYPSKELPTNQNRSSRLLMIHTGLWKERVAALMSAMSVKSVGQLILSCRISQSTSESSSPLPASGINGDGHEGNQTSDYGIFQGFHTCFVFEKFTNHLILLIVQSGIVQSVYLAQQPSFRRQKIK